MDEELLRAAWEKQWLDRVQQGEMEVVGLPGRKFVTLWVKDTILTMSFQLELQVSFSHCSLFQYLLDSLSF